MRANENARRSLRGAGTTGGEVPKYKTETVLVVESPTFLLAAGTMVLVLQHAILHALGARGVLASGFFPGVASGCGSFAFTGLKGGQQTLTGKLAVHGLGTGILNRHGNIRRQMAERHAGRNLVDVLATRPGGPAEGFLQFGFIELCNAIHDAGLKDGMHPTFSQVILAFPLLFAVP